MNEDKFVTGIAIVVIILIFAFVAFMATCAVIVVSRLVF